MESDPSGSSDEEVENVNEVDKENQTPTDCPAAADDDDNNLEPTN